MKGRKQPAIRTVLSSLLEHSYWASRSWVEATMGAIGDAILEAADGPIALRVRLAQTKGDAAERERALRAALESFGDGHELRTLGLRYLRLRNQFRPIWSLETRES